MFFPFYRIIDNTKDFCYDFTYILTIDFQNYRFFLHFFRPDENHIVSFLHIKLNKWILTKSNALCSINVM